MMIIEQGRTALTHHLEGIHSHFIFDRVTSETDQGTEIDVAATKCTIID